MDKNRLHVLLVEDDEEDYYITRTLLQDVQDFHSEIEWVTTCQEGIEKVKEQKYDVCLLDYRLGSCTGLEFLQQVNAFNQKTPIILLTGLHNREIDVKAMEAGASDYLIKENLDGFILERSVRHAIERKKYESQLLEVTDELAIALREIKDNQKNLIEVENLRSVRELAGAVAHEFSQPLQALTNYLSLIKASGNIEPFIGKAESMVVRVAELTENLRNITSLSKKKYVDTHILDLKNASLQKTNASSRILVVDDEQAVLDSLTEMLKLNNFECDGALNGEAALQLLEKNDYKLIISDVSMPSMSGPQLFQKIKAKGNNSVFIFLTGYEVSDDVKDVVKKADALWSKPVAIDRFINAVQKLMT